MKIPFYKRRTPHQKVLGEIHESIANEVRSIAEEEANAITTAINLAHSQERAIFLRKRLKKLEEHRDEMLRQISADLAQVDLPQLEAA